ncbi:MAG: sigma-70 family RNA polymerase sigma factor [Candidatus Binataceae bacterium]
MSEFRDLLVEHLPRLRAYALGLTRSTSAADDLLQQTALKAWAAREQFALGTNFKAWIYRILRNEHISSFRGSKQAQVSIDTVPEEFFARHGDQETKLLTREVLTAVNTLAPHRREVLLLNCAGGLSYQEIAEALGCSIGTVKSRLWRARHEIQLLMLGDESPDQPMESDEALATADARETETNLNPVNEHLPTAPFATGLAL